jgi:hypothetical protein
MAAPAQRPRGQGGGGPLIVLGVILALVAAVLVYVLTNGSSGIGGQGVLVVTSSQSLQVGTLLAPGSNGAGANIDTVFHVEHLPASVVPTDAYAFTSQAALDKAMTNLVVIAPFLAGDILRQNDTRFAPLGAGLPGSITQYNPAALPNGDVIFSMTGIGAAMPVQDGDHIDLLAAECVNSATSRGPCLTVQTTLQDLAVYKVKQGTIFLAVTPQNALILQLLVETAQLDIVVRKPGNDGSVSTQAVNLAWILAHYGFGGS